MKDTTRTGDTLLRSAHPRAGTHVYTAAVNRYSSNAVIERRRAARPVRYDVSGVQLFSTLFFYMYAVYFEKLGQREKERLDKAERRDRGMGGGWRGCEREKIAGVATETRERERERP